jgi:hypothetical protein
VCRISPVSEDWAVKGCHLHVHGIGVALRPDHLGGVVCRKVFASTPDRTVEAATKLVFEQLADPRWRRKLIETVERVMEFLSGLEGLKKDVARGRLRELSMLVLALERHGPS